MRMDKAQRLVDFGMEEIERIAPANSQIEVDVKEDSSGHFWSLLKVRVNHKEFFVKKEGNSMYESFHKAMRALKSQLSKNKNFHRIHRPKYQLAWY